MKVTSAPLAANSVKVSESGDAGADVPAGETGRLRVELEAHPRVFSPEEAAELLRALAEAVQFLHERGIQVATARGGNVLGGGDFSVDRLVPDIVRAALSGEMLDIRSPMATRPWQRRSKWRAGT